MAKMIRKQIYMQEAQDGFLKAKARELQVTEAEVVREALEVYQTYGSPEMILDSSAWLKEREFISKLAARSKDGAPLGADARQEDEKTAKRTWKREDLYER